MALKIYEKFAPRANVGDTNYPNGSIKNESAPGANDGTPLDADWGNDYAGFDAALFAEAGITPSGDPDTVLSSQRLDALKLLDINNLSLPYVFDTVADMVASSIVFPVNKKITTKGGSAIGDGSGNDYVVKAAQPLTFGDKTLANGSIAVLQKSFMFNSLQLNPSGTPTVEFDTATNASWCTAGTNAFPNKLGVNNTAPVIGGFPNDTAYVTGGANEAGIVSGYDNVNNALAGTIASQHSILYTGADHSSIFGGSLLAIHGGSFYSNINGGTQCTIEGDFTSYSKIENSINCNLKKGTTVEDSGFRASISTSVDCDSYARNSFMVGSISSTLNKNAKYSFAHVADSVIDTSNSLHVGSNLTTSSGSRILVVGDDILASGSSNAVAIGSGHTLNHTHTIALGKNCTPPFSGTSTFSSRQRSSEKGANQSLHFNCNNETTDAVTAVRLSTSGSTGFPRQPENSIVDGRFYISGVDVATGDVYSSEISFTTKRVGAGTPVISHQSSTVKATELTPAVAPVIAVTSSGIYRVQLAGEVGKTIAWDAAFYGHQTVYA